MSVVMMGVPFSLPYLHDHGWINLVRIPSGFAWLGTAVLLTGFGISTYVFPIAYKAVTGRLHWVENNFAFLIAFVISSTLYFGFLVLMLFSLARYW